MIREKELKHHGIKGQKWGDRNGPPYPLNPSSHSKSEVKAGYKKSIKKENNNKSTNNKQPNRKHKMSDTERMKLMRNIAIGVGVVGVGAAVAAPIIAKRNFDKDAIIKGKQILQRIDRDGRTNMHDVFYAAINNADKKIYERVMSGVKIKMHANNDLKIAGGKNAQRIFNDLRSSNRDFDKSISMFGIQDYKDFNDRILTIKYHQPAFDPFRKAIEKAGYDGIMDLNDLRGVGGGYQAKSPVIIFDPSKITIDSFSKNTINQGKYYLEALKMNLKASQKEIGLGVGASGALYGYLFNQLYKQENNKSEEKNK